MKINVTVEGTGKKTFEQWIDGVTRREKTANLNRSGKNIVASLVRHSPVDTGEMADSWDYNINKEGSLKWSINITNDSHDETHLSVPVLIQKGHGIKGGGYVRSNPFITRAMNDVYEEEITNLLKGLLD